jgi:hypothetical protein
MGKTHGLRNEIKPAKSETKTAGIIEASKISIPNMVYPN